MIINKEEHTKTEYFNVHLQMTTFCNMGCPGCYQEELTKKSFIDVHDVIYSFHTILDNFQPKEYKITFFGGEPLYAINVIEKFLLHLIKIKEELKGTPKYQNLKEINIPTSGGPNGLLLKKHLIKLIELTKALDVKLTIPVSFDGIDNYKLRNVQPDSIIGIYNFIKKYEDQYQIDILPPLISCVIPQNITEDYFVDNVEYIYKVLKKPGSFTIPHLLDKKGNLFNDPNIFKLAVRKLLSKDIPKEAMPKLFSSTIEKIYKKHNYNWCGAGESHMAILTNGNIKTCEYITGDGPVLLNKMDTHCISCEIKQWCQRPCLKNMEVDEDLFLAQCTLRKIIFNEIKLKLIKKD